MKPTSTATPGSPEPGPRDPLWDHPAGRRWLGHARWLRDEDQEHPWFLDCLVALFVLLLGIGSVRLGPPRDVFGSAPAVPAAFLVATAAAQSLPLAWRRRAPLTVLWIVLAVCIAQVSIRVALRSDLGLMVALYSVARYASLQLRGLLWAAGCTLGALAVAIFRVPHLLHQTPFVLFFVACAVTASFALGLAARARQAQLSTLADRAARLETEREQRIRLAIAEERARVSREMHDIVGHTLAVIIGLADGGARQAPADPQRGAEVLRIIAGAGRQALGELRLTLGALRERQPDSGGAVLSPQPGIADLADLLDRTRAAGPQVTFVTEGDIAALPPRLQLAAYRIVQEALTNALKHAGPATAVRVSLSASDQAVRVAVEDTGRPPGQRVPPPDGHDRHAEGHGLIGIRERAALAGGTAEAGSRAGGGWAVRASLPVSDSREQP